MLVIANGAYKSGSTWLFRIVQGMTGYSLPPAGYEREGWKQNGVAPQLLKKFLDEVDYDKNGYVFKAHVFWHFHLIANRPNVKVLNVTRDVRDVVVSAFHYERLKGRHDGDDFGEFYWKKGRHTAHWVTHYNRLWAGAGNCYAASYEGMQADFPAEVRKIAGFLGVSVADEMIETLRAQTTLNEMRAKYDEVSSDGSMHFYRKGMVGDWQNHFDEKMLADIRRIAQRHVNYPTWLDRIVYQWHRKIRGPKAD